MVNGGWTPHIFDPKTGYTILLNSCEYIHYTPLAVLGYLIGTKGCGINLINNDSKTLTFSFNQIFENFKWCVVNIFI